MAEVFRTASSDIQAIIGEVVRISPRLFSAFSSARYPRDMEEVRNQISADMAKARRRGEKVKLTASTQNKESEGLVYLTPAVAIEILLNNQQWTVDVWAGDGATPDEQKELKQKALQEGWQQIAGSP